MPESDRLRVGFYATALGSGGGMERYTREMLRALGRRDDVELVVAASVPGRDEPGELAPENLVDVIVVRGPGPIGRGLRERYALGSAFEAYDVDVVHGTKHILPRTGRPTVLTVHDVMVLTWPDQYRRRTKYLLPRQYLRAMRAATVIVSSSNATRDRLFEIDPALGSKTVTVAIGVSTALLDAAPEPIPDLVGRPFAIVVGDPSPRKNLGLLLDLWEDVTRECDLALVVVGPEGWRSRSMRRRLESLQETGAVFWAGRVSDSHLRWCYDHTRVVLVPSREEGYGLPVVEALALGAPVIASTDPALVEVGAGRVRHLDPDDAPGWTAAVVEVAGSNPVTPAASPPPDLPTWDACVDGTIAAYRLAIARAGGSTS